MKFRNITIEVVVGGVIFAGGVAEGLVYSRNRGAWRRRDCISSERSERRRWLNA